MQGRKRDILHIDQVNSQLSDFFEKDHFAQSRKPKRKTYSYYRKHT